MNVGLLRTKLNDSEFIHLSYRPFIPSARKIELPQPSRVGLSGNAWSAGLKDLEVAPSVVPHSLFNHASARLALKQQIQTFGAIRTSATIKTSKVSYTSSTLKEIYSKLTPQQVLVAELLSDGKSHKEIGVILGISQQSVTDRVIRMRNRLS